MSGRGRGWSQAKGVVPPGFADGRGRSLGAPTGLASAVVSREKVLPAARVKEVVSSAPVSATAIVVPRGPPQKDDNDTAAARGGSGCPSQGGGRARVVSSHRGRSEPGRDRIRWLSGVVPLE